MLLTFLAEEETEARRRASGLSMSQSRSAVGTDCVSGPASSPPLELTLFSRTDEGHVFSLCLY